MLFRSGIYTHNYELADLNGRKGLWRCVAGHLEEILPWGVGIDHAFPRRYCAESGWFAHMRHPENMFLSGLVEGGIPCLLAYLLLFGVVFDLSLTALRRGNSLPLCFNLVFFYRSLISAPLYHYLPFLPQRDADRGVFNSLLVECLWVMVVSRAATSSDTPPAPTTS